MHVVLNAQLLSRAHSFRTAGISRHIYHLLRELARDPRGHRFDVFVPDLPPREDPVRANGALRFHPTGALTARPPVRIAWEQTMYPLRLAGLRPALVHNLAYAAPLAWAGPSVLTIYDLSFLRFPEAFKRGNRLYLSTITRLSARRARRIVTISEHTKRDVVDLFGVSPERVDVTYLAADARYRPLPSAEVEAFRRAQRLPEVFLFYLGTLEPRKNLVGLLEAYARMAIPRPPLVVAGATGWRYSPIFDRMRALRLGEDEVRFLGFVPEEDLPLWYNAARLFTFPSLYEGFGLPILEAMACGTPVVTSNAASLPEVGGEAAIQVPPNATDLLAREMQRVVDDADQRARMRQAGLEQARRFRWETMADQTVQCYERAVHENAA